MTWSNTKPHIRRYCWNGQWVWATFRSKASPKPFLMAGLFSTMSYVLQKKARHAVRHA